jgi:hypothetical protein
MWQIEDIIRAFEFDFNKIEESIISKYAQPEEVKDKIRNWYADLMTLMKQEQIEKSGHLKMVKGVLNELFEFHKALLKSVNETKYADAFQKAIGNIAIYREKSKLHNATDVEVALSGLYAFLLMKLQKREITPETISAMATFSNMLGLLSAKFRKYEEGELEI